VWSPVPDALPFSSNWADAAVAPDSLWVPRNGAMYRYDLATATWSTHATGIPDGEVQLTAAVFDGDGYIWYHGPVNDLVRYDPSTRMALSFTHSAASGYMFETRMAYDPVTNSVVFTGFLNSTFTIYDIDTGIFSLSSPSPGGDVHDNTCQDRSGNIYTGATSYSQIYQYNVAANLWTALGPLPFDHDNVSTCVVSQDGYLYYASGTSFARLPLGVH
jgi:streptogramin lyase